MHGRGLRSGHRHSDGHSATVRAQSGRGHDRSGQLANTQRPSRERFAGSRSDGWVSRFDGVPLFSRELGSGGITLRDGAAQVMAEAYKAQSIGGDGGRFL